MSAAELRRFIEIDGHVGLEEEQEHAARFGRFFQYVASEPRYAPSVSSSEEFLKQADKYGLPLRTIFSITCAGCRSGNDAPSVYGHGLRFQQGFRSQPATAKSGLYVFLKASDAPLGPFYNEHRDRRALFGNADNLTAASYPSPSSRVSR